jgi:Family of unknown function (DUF5675)
MNLHMIRTGDGFGSLFVSHSEFVTLELPWRDNAPDDSCVPVGDYDLIPYESATHGLVYRLDNPSLNVYGTGVVPEGGRFAIEMHSGNWAADSLGCILVGLSDGTLLNPATNKDEPAILDSDAAMDQLRLLLGTQTGHTLAIS